LPLSALRLTGLVVFDNLRTRLAQLMVPHLRPLVVQAWLWLAAQAEDIEEKRHCLNAALQLDPENEPAS